MSLESIIIVGGGAFGLTTALELVNTKYKGRGHLITVLDRSSTPPAADAASSDYNKVRLFCGSYPDRDSKRR